MERLKIADLDVIEVAGDPSSPIIIMLHGYGASAHDLYPLHSSLNIKSNPTWYFPNGIIKVPLGPNIYGRAWFPIDMEALMLARMQGTFRDLSLTLPSGMIEAQNVILNFIEALSKKFKFNKEDISKKIIIGGFSQGAMVSTQVALNLDEDITKLILLSGTLLAKEVWSKKAKLKKNITYFQSHGTDDMILPYEMAVKLNEILTEAGLKGSFYTFNGGHEIPYDILKKMEAYLND